MPPALPEPSATVGSSDVVGESKPNVTVPPFRSAVHTSPVAGWTGTVGAAAAAVVGAAALTAAAVVGAAAFTTAAAFAFVAFLTVFVAPSAGLPTASAADKAQMVVESTTLRKFIKRPPPEM